MVHKAIAAGGVVAFGMCFACGGLDFGDTELLDVTESEAIAAGYTPPAGSEHIYVQQHALPDLTVVYMQVSLNRSDLAKAVVDIADRAELQDIDGAAPPSDWPNFDRMFYDGSGGPFWWTPDGDTYVYERFANNAGETGVGNAWFVDETGGTVSILSFQLEGWSIE